MQLCRICGKEPKKILDLGAQPIANALLTNPDSPETIYPLEFYWCFDCQFGQVNDVPPSLFGETYPYYSSINTSYVKQCEVWAKEYIKKYDPKTVLEIGSNDGYMLQYFKHLTHIGYEPSLGPALLAKEKGIQVATEYFRGTDNFFVDLIIANNVLAHTPNLHQMVAGISKSLSIKGQVVIEFPGAYKMIDKCYYDTIYHEHYSYFTTHAIQKLFAQHGLFMTEQEFIPSHGGSTKAYFNKIPNDKEFFQTEISIGNFHNRVRMSKIESLQKILIKSGRSMALFGAAAKGNTFLNYLGLKSDIFDFCVDDTPAKQGKFLPGSRIPIVGMDVLREKKPDILYILPWNFKDEIINKTAFIKEWAGVHMTRL